jgi:hypothetical protein
MANLMPRLQAFLIWAKWWASKQCHVMSRQAGLKFKLFSRRRSDNPLNVPSKQTTFLMFPIIILKEDKVSILNISSKTFNRLLQKWLESKTNI